eukprot:1248783-Amorphochlora_amoeboformis.AAC.3
MKIMQNPEFIKRIDSLRADPEMAKIFNEMESGGMEAMMKYYNDPTFLAKLSEKLGDMSGIVGGSMPDFVCAPGAMGKSSPQMQEYLNRPEVQVRYFSVRYKMRDLISREVFF